MTKVVYNGEIIELVDKLEKGFKELDMLTSDNEINLENTMEFKTSDLEKTQELNLGDIHE